MRDSRMIGKFSSAETAEVYSTLDLRSGVGDADCIPEIGHTARHCKQERAEWDKVEIKCGNCGEIGHRVRDCKEKRRNKYGCRNCGYDFLIT